LFGVGVLSILNMSESSLVFSPEDELQKKKKKGLDSKKVTSMVTNIFFFFKIESKHLYPF
jgi:hypothetical protein